MGSMVDPNRKKQLTLPVTVKMVLKAGKPRDGVEGVVIHGQSCNKVCVVAQVMGIRRGLGFFELDLDDNTGVIDCMVYFSTDDGNSKVQETLVNTQLYDYVEIIGSARLREGKEPMITGFVVNPVKNSNKIPQHLLEAVRCGIEITKKKPLEQLTPFSSAADGTTTGITTTDATTAVKDAPMTDAAPTAGGGGAGLPSAPVVKEDLDSFLKKRLTEIPQGRTKEEAVEMCIKAGYLKDDAGKLYDDWMVEGVLYETITNKFAFLEGI